MTDENLKNIREKYNKIMELKNEWDNIKEHLEDGYEVYTNYPKLNYKDDVALASIIDEEEIEKPTGIYVYIASVKYTDNNINNGIINFYDYESDDYDYRIYQNIETNNLVYLTKEEENLKLNEDVVIASSKYDSNFFQEVRNEYFLNAIRFNPESAKLITQTRFKTLKKEQNIS